MPIPPPAKALATSLLLALTAIGPIAQAIGPIAQASGPVAQASDELETYQKRLGKLFRQLDRNGDARLDRDEVRANAYLQRHFDRLDRGNKGYLVRGDLR